MNLAKKVRRSRQRLCLAPEFLEDRVVLSAGQGSTFAIMPGSVTTAGQVSTINFTMSSAMFATWQEARRRLDWHRRRFGDAVLVKLDGDGQAGDRLDQERIGKDDPGPAFDL